MCLWPSYRCARMVKSRGGALGLQSPCNLRRVSASFYLKSANMQCNAESTLAAVLATTASKSPTPDTSSNPEPTSCIDCVPCVFSTCSCIYVLLDVYRTGSVACISSSSSRVFRRKGSPLPPAFSF